jgi:hypothetical protein
MPKRLRIDRWNQRRMVKPTALHRDLDVPRHGAPHEACVQAQGSARRNRKGPSGHTNSVAARLRHVCLSAPTDCHRSSALTMPSWIALAMRAGFVGAGRPTATYFSRTRCRCVRTVDGSMKSACRPSPCSRSGTKVRTPRIVSYTVCLDVGCGRLTSHG